ncbi:hypothetical protein [Cohnella nanjingensis]|uniref:YozE SAM-like domain-containing protein n=1 Tax=Cohnella nanjingensis TaxID=1387779 RepID=A0A7X0VF51_9BACL|nr:hypothetical protein [Cohnella nanjingensis]MBB6670254.1 hypothetical protein [Cohnella nanjingensis]
MYSDLVNQFLAYSRKHPEGDGDIYDRYKRFLMFIGFDDVDASYEAALWMDRVADLMA